MERHKVSSISMKRTIHQQKVPAKKDEHAAIDTLVDPHEVEWFHWIQDFTDKLTFKRIFVVLMTGLLITFITMIYENRSSIFQSIYSVISPQQDNTWEVSQATKDQLIALVETSTVIKMAAITDIDLQKNRRVIKFRRLNDPDSVNIKAKADALLPQPVFNDDARNTQQIVGVLNNEFVCSPYNETSYYHFFPDLGKRMPVVCRIAIPPFYGNFIGMLTLGLKITPTKQELDSIRIEATRIAIEIYLRDVKKSGNQRSSSPK